MENTQVTTYVELKADKVYTTSRIVAEKFGKSHKHVLRTIRELLDNLAELKEISRSNFGPSEFIDSRGKRQIEYTMDEDAFALLAMRFTGPEALKIQVKFVSEFRRVRELLKSSSRTEDRLMARNIDMLMEKVFTPALKEIAGTFTQAIERVTNVVHLNQFQKPQSKPRKPEPTNQLSLLGVDEIRYFDAIEMISVSSWCDRNRFRQLNNTEKGRIKSKADEVGIPVEKRQPSPHHYNVYPKSFLDKIIPSLFDN